MWNNVPLNGWPQLKGMENLSEALTVLDDVTALKLVVGNEDNGLVKDVDDLQTTVGDSSAGLVKDVDDLQTIVGDNTGGLVKDVDDLQTVVGDSSAGLVKDVDDLGSYSTTETVVGKWGNDVLYRKVIDFGALPNQTTKSVSSGLSNVNIVKIYGVASSNDATFPLPYVDEAAPTSSIRLIYLKTNNEVSIRTQIDRSGYSGYVILEYTKTSSRDIDPEEVKETIKTKNKKS